MNYLPYMVAAAVLLWLGSSQVDLIQTTIDTPHPAGMPAAGVFRAIEILRYLVIASAVAFPALVYLIHNGRTERRP